MVSDTRCPALSDCELAGGEAGQRPRRGQSPVEHFHSVEHFRSFVLPEEGDVML